MSYRKCFKKFEMSFEDMENQMHKELLTAMKLHREKVKKRKEHQEKKVTKRIEALEKKREKMQQKIIDIDNLVYSLQLSLIHSSC